LKEHESTAIYAICPGTGQVQLRILGTPQKSKESARLWSLADKVYGLVQDFDGALSCQEALGLSRLPWQTKMSAGVLPSLLKIKELFDPYSQFNPGKVVGTSSEIPIWPFRNLGDLENQPDQNKDTATTIQPILKWKDNSPLLESSHCNGCGLCRTQSSAKRMCPTNRVIKNEHATPEPRQILLECFWDHQKTNSCLAPKKCGMFLIYASTAECAQLNALHMLIFQA
ncbi:MAG: FAD-binding oxidoreductase, partial [Planctomycetes bacterium]|nr:FAD-binding oxidoreductase [Planctomycetota bacterium]